MKLSEWKWFQRWVKETTFASSSIFLTMLILSSRNADNRWRHSEDAVGGENFHSLWWNLGKSLVNDDDDD